MRWRQHWLVLLAQAVHLHVHLAAALTALAAFATLAALAALVAAQKVTRPQVTKWEFLLSD